MRLTPGPAAFHREQALLAATARTAGDVDMNVRRREACAEIMLELVLRNPTVFGAVSGADAEALVRDRARW